MILPVVIRIDDRDGKGLLSEGYSTQHEINKFGWVEEHQNNYMYNNVPHKSIDLTSTANNADGNEPREST